MLKKSVMILMLCLLAGCKVGEDYKKPKTQVPQQWNEVGVSQKNAPIQQEWWKYFHDERLNYFIEKGANQNIDLKIARTRIEEARANRALAKGDLFPTVDAIASDERQANRLSIGNSPIDLTKPFSTYEAGFDASWELDLFGKKMSVLASQTATYQAIKADNDAARVSMLAEIASTYVAIRDAQAHIQLAQAVITNQTHVAAITQRRSDVGKIAEVETVDAEAKINEAKSQITLYQQKLAENQYAMDVLLAEKPGFTSQNIGAYRTIPESEEDVIVAAPAKIVQNRPDIRAAEKRLQASVEDINMAKAAFYPDISLSAFLGLLSSTSDSFLLNKSKSWDIGANIDLPILNFGRLSSQLHISKARQKEALLSYQKTVLSALAEVETALAAYYTQAENRDTLSEAVEDAETSLRIANKRYHLGATNYFAVLEAERNLYAEQKDLAESNATLALDVIKLYKSLGGGWKVNSAVPR